MISPCCHAPSGVDQSRKAEYRHPGGRRRIIAPAGTVWRRRYCKTCNGVFETIEVTRAEYERGRSAVRLMAAE